MSETEEEVGVESGGTAVLRVLTRSLNMKRGHTEKRWLRGSEGWSKRGQALIDKYNELLAIHDRLSSKISAAPDEEDFQDDFRSLTNAVAEIEDDYVKNNRRAREEQKGAIEEQITAAEELEEGLDAYFTRRPMRMKGLLAPDSPAGQRLLQSAQKDELMALVDRMPPTEKTVQALEEIEDAILGTDPCLIAKEAHEIFFRKKTDAFEAIIQKKLKKSKNKNLVELKKLPPEEYWRLLMDGNSQEKGDKHFYDRSQGFMASMMKGLNLVVDEIDTEMSVDFVKDMHACATYQVTIETGSELLDPTKFQEQGLKKSPNGWGVCRDYSEEGLDELKGMRDEMNEIAPDYFRDGEEWNIKGKMTPSFKAGEGYREGGEGALQPVVEQLMGHAIEKYQEDIGIADEEDDADAKTNAKIAAVIDCCRRLGQIHPFKDANGRLMMFLLLNKMLMENGLRPTILPDQGLMIGKGRDELIELIKAGQEKVGELQN